MPDREKVVTALECLADGQTCACCDYKPYDDCSRRVARDVIDMLKEQDKEIKALRLLVEWAEECDFGFDQFPEEYERYKDEIEDMGYIDGMIHVAKRTLEDHGAFEEGR